MRCVFYLSPDSTTSRWASENEKELFAAVMEPPTVGSFVYHTDFRVIPLPDGAKLRTKYRVHRVDISVITPRSDPEIPLPDEIQVEAQIHLVPST